MRILFICLSTLEFTVRTPYTEPLGGTESALAYLSVELAKLGHDVTLMRKASDLAVAALDGVTHVPISEDLKHLEPDVVVVTSAPQAFPAIRKIVPSAKLVLWNHMRPDQPAMLHIFQKETQEAVDNIVYVSDVQRSAFVGASRDVNSVLSNPNHGTIINNAMAPCFENMFSSAEELLMAKKCRGVYTSTPFRGLAILAHLKDIPIDVYSSMKVYQGDDTGFTAMYEQLGKNPCLKLYGSVPQPALRDALFETSFFVYPSIFAECHSIAILEAMAAGLKVVTTDLASPQTDYIDSMASLGGSLEEYGVLLRRNINFFRSEPEAWAKKIFEQVQYVNDIFTWRKKALEWNIYLKNLMSPPQDPNYT